MHRPAVHRLAAVVLLVLTLGSTTAGTVSATAPGHNGKLVFRRYMDTDHTWGGLFTANPDGSGVAQITHPPRRVVDTIPSWSPRGGQIVFQRVTLDGCGPACETDEIYVVNSDGSGLQALARDGGSKGCIWHERPAGGTCRGAPTWSPDGKLIAFECTNLTATQTNPYLGRICVMNADGSNTHEIRQTPATGVGDAAPSWSPDGTRIAFQRAILDARGTVMRDAVFVMNADGSNVHRITPWALRAGQPDWSPNGRRIVFYSNWGGPTKVSANLYTVGVKGTGLRQLTHARGGRQQHLSATYSPDGRWITFSRTEIGGNADVFVMRTNGTHLRNVTSSAIWDSGVDWGPRR